MDRELFVRDMNQCEKRDLLKHQIRRITGREELDEGLDELAKNLSGFTAAEIISFMSSVRIQYPELKVDQLLQCVSKKDFVHLRLGDLICDIDPIYWSDIGGYESVKELLKDQLAVPLKSGRKIPKGILFHGPPGCSKTMFARALATECRLKLFAIQPSTLMRSLVGESEALLRNILLKAHASAPSIVFIDEIDTLLPRRSSTDKSSVSENLLNELMTFLDGIEIQRDQKVILMGATNCLDQLDEVIACFL